MRSSLVQRVSSGLGLVVHLLVGCGGEDLTVPDSAAGGSGGQGGAGASGVAGAGGAAGTSGTSGQGGGPAGAGQGGAGGGGAAGGGTAGAAGGAGCGAPLVACGVECVDTQTDVTHCGDCSGKCASGQQCVLGSCQGACTTLACDGVCVDPMNDSQHCGGCKVVCAKVCSQGKCADECTEGQVACDGACVDTQADATHCGGCDVSCGDGEVCFAGLCTVKCEAGKTACGGECVATATDVMHCGNCDKACVGSETCGDGVCMCQLPARDCGGSCIDAMSDPQNCGDCGKTCGDGSQCMSGVCQTVCTSTQTGCGGVCTDTKLDPKNCGMCGKACQTGQSCSQGVCANTCQAPTKQCSEGTCRDVQNDPENCGECGKTCGGKEACVAGVCKVTCKGGQNSPVDDPWGATWDGFERASTTLAMAEQTCAGIGGRLPTATELFRVSATQTASVGQTTNTSYLWSRVPTGPAGQAIVRLSDGVTSTAAVTVAEHFRCICPEERPDTFTGKSCNGPAASPCVPLPFEGGHTAADAMDRARLPRTGAIFECTESHGRVASPEEYAALIASGAPGSGQRLRASDAMSSDTDATVKWMNDASAGWTASDNVDDAALATALSFRCVGASVATAPLLPKVTSTFLGKKSRLLVDSASSSAGTWGAAYDVCTNRGGHVARVDELWRLAQDDLPGDSLLLSTSDQVGASITNGILNGWLLASIKWTGDMPRLGDAAVSWTYRTTKGPLVRCAYYPIDKPYPGPSESQCNGGCFQEVLPGTGASIWVDAQDRGPDASLEQAYATCREHGGHLASQRDLVEAIHGGLGMGQGKGLLTSDLAAGNQAAARAIVSIFTGAPGTADSDQSPTYASWSTLSTPRPYRCMWTNELR